VLEEFTDSEGAASSVQIGSIFSASIGGAAEPACSTSSSETVTRERFFLLRSTISGMLAVDAYGASQQ
jgi:hypothetical protein